MKITYFLGNITQYDHGLSEVVRRVKNVFTELEAETDSVDLGALHPPYYDGDTTSAIDGIMEKVKLSNGIVLACTAQLFAPTALMQCFLEYLQHPDYADILKNKHCMVVVLSQEGGEKSALDYLNKAVQYFGGYAVSQIGLQVKHLAQPETDEFIDKAAEDFYRAVKLNRQYVIPTDTITKEVVVEKTVVVEKPIIQAEPARLEPFSDTQEKEIEEISLLFTEKMKGAPIAEESPAPVAEPAIFKPKPAALPSPTPQALGQAKRLTQELPNRFQSQLSAGLQALVQINISGNEQFDCYLNIHSTECTYYDGQAPAPDITIMADSAIWTDVLSGKSTAQKAFMIGGIKVRGDFVLLTKFDTLFAQ
ncbi:MAG: SCP2 sterol-binding domain-containing protein [Defluviitaleaceae bacterium]|nr:SCP2 sterol-binding domain-containing protein [Defluviitaleaceae bacterium]